MSGRVVLLVGSIVVVGLIAGLFFGWVVSVIPGLKKVNDTTYVSVMQNINREIINPWFVIPFMVAPLLLGAAAVVEFRAGNTRRSWTLSVAAITYLVGVLGVTIGGNIPLNNSLDAFDSSATSSNVLSRTRREYETPWNRWHNLRTTASVLAFVTAATAATISDGEG